MSCLGIYAALTIAAAGGSSNDIWPVIPTAWLHTLGATDVTLVILSNGDSTRALQLVTDPQAETKWHEDLAASRHTLYDTDGHVRSLRSLRALRRQRGEHAAVVVAVPPGDFFMYPGITLGHRRTLVRAGRGSAGRGSAGRGRNQKQPADLCLRFSDWSQPCSPGFA